MSWQPTGFGPDGWSPDGWLPDGTDDTSVTVPGLQPAVTLAASMFNTGASLKAVFRTNGPGFEGNMGAFCNLDASVDDEHNVAANF